ncbi:MAG TPA: protein phosphatase 2C domain-containing protein [Abditibacterium sp.]|jgi:protein phosphatase
MNNPISNPPRQADDATNCPHQNATWFCGKSDRGQVRHNNEDRFWLDGERNLFIVADGMGGHAAGEVASLVAVESLRQTLTPQIIAAAATSSNLNDQIAQALRQSNIAVRKASDTHREWSGMGSTAVVALLHGQTLHLANVGDSRAYLLRSGVLEMLSHDHSVAAVLAEQNHISAAEVRTHPLRNRLTVCLGIEARIEPWTSSIRLQPEDRILLCSDGLWDMLTDAEIAVKWANCANAEQAVHALIAAANQAGGHDNITVVALHIGDGFSTFTNRPVENSDAVSLDDTVVVPC